MAWTASRNLTGHLRVGAALGCVLSTTRIADADMRERRAPILQRRAILRCEAAQPKRKRVCCIGAGAAGLATAKEMVERGFDTTVLEAREGIGGVWRLDKTGTVVGVRREQRATSSKYYLGFSDFPIPDKAPDFVSHEDYLAYLEAYVDHFNLRDHIRVGHRTLDVRQASSGEWEVHVATASGPETLTFDAVAVCSGLHSTPDFPPVGAPVPPPSFKSNIIHARELKDASTTLAGKRIVVVGGGETGAEMAHIAAVVGKEPALMSLRRGITVIGTYPPLPLADRMPDARTPPVDLREARVHSLLPHSLKHFLFTRDREVIFALRDQNPGKYSIARLMDRVVFAAISGAFAPFLIIGSALVDVARTCSHSLFWVSSNSDFQSPDGVALSKEMKLMTQLPAAPARRLQRDTQQLLNYTQRAAWYRMQGYTAWHYQHVRSLLEEYSGACHTQNFLTKSDDFIYNLMDRSLELRPGITGYEDSDIVVFDDGTKEHVDLVVWCSGYQPRVPFLSSLLNSRGSETCDTGGGRIDGQDLFKNVFHPSLGSSIAFIGFARPQLGAMPPLAELQSRWFGGVLAGDVTLPSEKDMRKEMTADREQYSTKIFAERLRNTVNFANYTSDIALRIGCYPKVGFSTIFTDFALWQAFWLGPVLPESYRIGDPGVRGVEARKRLVEVYTTFFTRD